MPAPPPDFEELPSALHFAHEIVRAYRLEGRETALLLIENSSLGDRSERALAWAFMTALHADLETGWQYSRIERELGEALTDAARRLLEADPEDYELALSTLAHGIGLSSSADLKADK